VVGRGSVGAAGGALSLGSDGARPTTELLLLLSRYLLLRRYLRFRLRLGSRLVHKLEVSHQGGIALSRTEFDNSTIASLPIRGSGRQFGKQSTNRFFLPQKRKGHSTSMEIAPFAQSDHPLGERPNSLCFRQGRLDSIVLDKAANLIRQQKIPMFGFAAQLDRFLCVTHKLLQRHQFSLVASFAAHRRFNQS
jgi:hypothetical protein